MAIITRQIPKCDVCGGEWLPDKRLRDGSHNPAFDDPGLCKRCGKCKTPRWNEIAKNETNEQRGEAFTKNQGILDESTPGSFSPQAISTLNLETPLPKRSSQQVSQLTRRQMALSLSSDPITSNTYFYTKSAENERDRNGETRTTKPPRQKGVVIPEGWLHLTNTEIARRFGVRTTTILYARRKQAGLCLRCKGHVEPGFQHCAKHRDAINRSNRKRKGQMPWKPGGLGRPPRMTEKDKEL